MIRKWKAAGEKEFAEWFTKEHLHPKWDGWFVGAPGMAGIPVHTNDIESLNW